MSTTWMREFALAPRPLELTRALERIAEATAGPAQWWNLDARHNRLEREGQYLDLGGPSLAAQSLREGQRQSQARQHALPVRRFGSLIGALLVEHEQPDFATLDNLVETFALMHQGALELHQARQALSQFQELAVAATENGRTGHVAAVCQLSADLAEYLDFSTQARRRLWNAALYHDIGKALLVQRGESDNEREHPVIGGQFLSATGIYADLAELVATHHERFDGSGSPRALCGDQLSLDQWVLVLAEDLQEFLEMNPHLAFQTKMTIFFQEKARFHHPDAIDALAGLIDSGRLDRLK